MVNLKINQYCNLHILYYLPPGWQPSWAWYLAEAPALSAVACKPVPALTLLSGSSRKKPLASAEEREGGLCFNPPSRVGRLAGAPSFYVNRPFIVCFERPRATSKNMQFCLEVSNAE